MIGEFEQAVRMHPHRTFLTFVTSDGCVESYTYWEARLLSAAMALRLMDHGVRQGDCVVVDMPNNPAVVFLSLAAAYGGFSLVMMNHRLTEVEKMSRQFGLERVPGLRVATRIGEVEALGLVHDCAARIAGLPLEGGDEPRTARGSFGRGPALEDERAAVRPSGRFGTVGAGERRCGTDIPTRAMRARARDAASAMPRRARSRQAARVQVERSRAADQRSVVHFAEHAVRVFDSSARAVVMFTSGSTGHAKAVPLTWENLCSSARAANMSLCMPNAGSWQLALPLYHIGGFQVMVRSVLNGTPFALYEHFDARQLLDDAPRIGATHVSVVDKMLQDMLALAEGNAKHKQALRSYRCILLGGAAPNPSTLSRGVALKARVYASYGMTETSSMIANCLVTAGYLGGLKLLPGYAAHIVDPDEEGVGRLAVKGCGVFNTYLNAQATRTVDGFFLTGDSAALRNGGLYVQERTEDMFVSGGENVYPAEIRKKLLGDPAVSDAYVFGAPHPTWGRRPVAFVERAQEHPLDALQSPSRTNLEVAQDVLEGLVPRLSKVYLPDELFMLDEFPRTGIGKVDGQELRRLYDERICIRRVVLYRIRLPFKRPFRTSKGTLKARESLLVQVIDGEGRSGLGECVAFSSDWYLPETLRDDLPVLRDELAPALVGRTLLHPSDAFDVLSAVPGASAYPLAIGAIESAVWDLYGRISGKPLWRLLRESFEREGLGGANGTEGAGALTGEDRLQADMRQTPHVMAQRDVPSAEAGNDSVAAAGSPGGSVAGALDSTVAVPAGAVIGMGTVDEVLASARQSVAAGYSRLKLKVAPGCAYTLARAVREAFPGIMITLDANQSFWESQTDELYALDGLNVAWIEEPLHPSNRQGEATGDLFARLARLQRTLRTPICLDESIARPRDLMRALSYPELRCYAVKVGKLGGVAPTLRFMGLAAERGLTVWMGGMYDTGISRRVAAAFETLPVVSAPGDIGSTSRYFHTDVATPPYAVEEGSIYLNRAPFVSGIGCVLNEQALDQVLLERIVVE